MSTDKRLFTVQEAVQYLAISPVTLFHWISRREISVVRLRRKAVRLDKQVLDKFIELSTMEAAHNGTLQARQDMVAEFSTITGGGSARAPSHAAISGVDVQTIAAVLGHKTLRMRQRYSHFVIGPFEGFGRACSTAKPQSTATKTLQSRPARRKIPAS